jgi:hypothetical protein
MGARSLSSEGPDGHRALAHCKHNRIDERKKENTMRKVIVSEYVTLDGVMEDPGGAEGFKHGGWSFGFGGAEHLMIFPLVLGSGKRLFPGGNEKKVLKLVETRTLGSGVVLLTYQPDKA